MDNTFLIKRKRRKVGKEEVCGTALASIPIIGYMIFGIIPLVMALVMSLMSIKGLRIDANTKMAGFANYKDVLTDRLFWKSIAITLYAAVGMPISIILALIISTLLSKNIKGKKIYRSILFIPHVCSMVAISLMWQWIFDYYCGILNSLKVSMGGTKTNWLGNSSTVMPCMILMGVWGGMGYNIILLTAALNNVNRSFYEAAEIDGAGPWKKFFSITIPGISPTLFFLVTMGLIGALQDFTRFQIMVDNSKTNNAGLTAVYYLTNFVLDTSSTGGGYAINIGKASTIAIVLAAFIGLVTFVNFKLSKLWVSYD